ncbi:MAG: hypothetical protein AVDCRST_MAG26-3030 [uncultured Chloroflexia bacterium]|uniref:Uncharacterized protein n=1 Tax=uncultured Chloroflexia bacterium TaxID=1672391 RepID=A0A6J4JAV6_9CHLR|nr:MAG: hypothetical protein AVDCRST_MAG26-3030 [uncultured Chloroflexia bacterium]
MPLTYPQTETNPNGDTVRTQWFERARFEDHGSRGVLLGLLGRETLVTPIPGKPVHPIVDGDTGFLMGGVRAGAWLGPSMTSAHLRGGESYRLYTLAGATGQSSGGAPARQTFDPCSWTTSIALTPPPAAGALAVGGDWNARPRASVDLGTQSEVYRTAIADILHANGIALPDVRLTRVLRIDLEGDGVDEVLISATRLLEGRGSPQVTAGDYSLVALRKVVDGQVRTIMLAADYYREDSIFAAPDEYTIANLLDLNGDGRVEIVVDLSYYEGLGTTVYEIIGDRAEVVLQESCGV